MKIRFVSRSACHAIWCRMCTGLATIAACACAATAAAQIAPFTEEAIARGLAYVVPPPTSGLWGFGIGLVDLDRDGDLDVIALGDATGIVGIFENDGTGHFTDRSTTTGIPLIPGAGNFGAADWDADGDPDLVIVAPGAAPSFIRNDGAFTFTDVSTATGATTLSLTKGLAWGDVDGDGWIDLYITHHAINYPGTATTRNQLWRNNGDGTFTDVAAALGVNIKVFGLEVVLFDADQDGDLDIYASNDRGMVNAQFRNRFWRNDGGVMNEIGLVNGTGLGFFSMGVAIGDPNLDGDLDIYCTNTLGDYAPLYGDNPLFLRQSNGTYAQSNAVWGVTHHELSWATVFFDANNDGFEDLFVVNAESSPALYMHTGAPPMVNMTATANLQATALPMYCAVVGDVDGDGDLDMLTNPHNSNLRLHLNQTNGSSNWVKFRVVGERHDLEAIGATVRVTTGDTTQIRPVLVGGNGYLGQNGLDAHFGLGGTSIIDKIVVRWPYTGSVRVLTGYVINTRWTLLPPDRMGDFDADGVVTQADLSALTSRFGNPVVPGLEVLDMNGNGHLNSDDYGLLLAVGSASVGDLSGDGTVDGADLALILGSWGDGPSASDLDGDSTVNGADLAILLGNWG